MTGTLAARSGRWAIAASSSRRPLGEALTAFRCASDAVGPAALPQTGRACRRRTRAVLPAPASPPAGSGAPDRQLPMPARSAEGQGTAPVQQAGVPSITPVTRAHPDGSLSPAGHRLAHPALKHCHDDRDQGIQSRTLQPSRHPDHRRPFRTSASTTPLSTAAAAAPRPGAIRLPVRSITAVSSSFGSPRPEARPLAAPRPRVRGSGANARLGPGASGPRRTAAGGRPSPSRPV